MSSWHWQVLFWWRCWHFRWGIWPPNGAKFPRDWTVFRYWWIGPVEVRYYA